jgi:uncharacterized protein (DUF433 family)
MIDWNQCTAVERLEERVSGAWVFKGTRVPVRALFENLESGARVEDFLDWFPGVSREQVSAVLRYAEESLAAAWNIRQMRILFDQGTPVPLRRHLPEHPVFTAFELGWSSLSNGDLLAAAEGKFELLITTDQNLRYQQNLKQRSLAVLVLPTTSWPEIQKHIPAIVSAVCSTTRGGYTELRW